MRIRLVHLAAAMLVVASVAAAQERDSTARSAVSTRTLVLPYFGSAPETGFQYGATAFRVQQPADTLTRPSTQQIFASYTAKSQAVVWAEVDRWTARNDWRLTGRVEWQRFPLAYYGVGDTTRESAEEIYTPRGIVASLAVQRRIGGPLYALAGWRYQDMDIVETDSGGILRRGGVRGARGGRVGQLRLGAIWDGRDDVFAPARGSFVQGTAAVAAAPFASDYDFIKFNVDARRYFPVGEQRVVAVQGVLEMTEQGGAVPTSPLGDADTRGGGDAPFDQLSLVGGSNYLRGYVRGRVRDRHLAAVQAEYRGPLIGRLGWAAFAGGGWIAPSVADLGDARFLPSYGAGLRWRLFAKSRSAIRVDYARGLAGNSGLYVALNEAF